MSGQLLQAFVGLVRMDDLHQLDLVELVLADHAACVLAVGTGFRTEAGRMTDELQRQPVRGQNFIPHDVGDGNFGGGNQVKLSPVGFGYREQVFLELRQLPGAAHAVRVDHIGHVHFGVAVLAAVHVEHELRNCAMQARQRSLHQREARAADLCRGIEIQHAQPGPDIDMILGGKVELARLAHPADLDVVVSGCSGRHARMRQVWNSKQEVIDRFQDRNQSFLVVLQPLRKFIDLGHQRGGHLLIAFLLCLSYLFR